MSPLPAAVLLPDILLPPRSSLPSSENAWNFGFDLEMLMGKRKPTCQAPGIEGLILGAPELGTVSKSAALSDRSSEPRDYVFQVPPIEDCHLGRFWRYSSLTSGLYLKPESINITSEAARLHLQLQFLENRLKCS